MVILFDILLVFIIFFLVKWLTWKITDEWGLPEWLQFKPWICNICLTFWSLITVYISIWLSFSCLTIGIGGVILASLNALAMWIDQRNNTVRIEDFEY